MNISYDYYKVFYYVAKYKSFTLAAKMLYSKQPNITRVIKKIEEEFNCALFVRHKNGVELTVMGEKLYQQISLAIECLEKAENEIKFESNILNNTITIAVSEIALHSYLVPFLNTLCNKHPEIHIKILNKNTIEAIKYLYNDLADFAIVTDPFEKNNDLYIEKLRDIKEVLVGKNINSSFKIEDINSYSIVGLGQNTSSFNFFFDYFASKNLLYKPEIETSTADQILPIIKTGLGVGFVPIDFLNNEDYKKLKVIEIDDMPKRSICMIRKRNKKLNYSHKIFEKMILSNNNLKWCKRGGIRCLI